MLSRLRTLWDQPLGPPMPSLRPTRRPTSANTSGLLSYVEPRQPRRRQHLPQPGGPPAPTKLGKQRTGTDPTELDAWIPDGLARLGPSGCGMEKSQAKWGASGTPKLDAPRHPSPNDRPNARRMISQEADEGGAFWAGVESKMVGQSTPGLQPNTPALLTGLLRRSGSREAIEEMPEEEEDDNSSDDGFARSDSDSEPDGEPVGQVYRGLPSGRSMGDPSGLRRYIERSFTDPRGLSRRLDGMQYVPKPLDQSRFKLATGGGSSSSGSLVRSASDPLKDTDPCPSYSLDPDPDYTPPEMVLNPSREGEEPPRQGGGSHEWKEQAPPLDRRRSKEGPTTPYKPLSLPLPSPPQNSPTTAPKLPTLNSQRLSSSEVWRPAVAVESVS